MLTPGEFSRRALLALDASEGRSKRRKRDQTPDRLGMDLKRELLQRAADENPSADEFEGWLLQQVLTAPASGPVRAMCADILNEYRLSCFDPSFEAWLAEGAPSADTMAAMSEGGEACAVTPSPATER